MAENTKIEWADHTFNPWIGCTAVSPACDHCYAEALATTRLGVGWGPHAPRRRTAASTWRQPLAWDRKAQREGTRPRVFCASLADVFDNQVPDGWRFDLWALIASTPHLDWLLLTKRPQNIAKMLPTTIFWGGGRDLAWPWPNVWLGTTVENQEEADRRIPHLLRVPAARRFLSCEPLLGPVDLRRVQGPNGIQVIDALAGTSRDPAWFTLDARIGWIICGGESGPGARPCNVRWVRQLRDQCERTGTAFFLKQWGDWWPAECHPWPEGSLAAAFARAGISRASPDHPRRGVFGFDDIFHEGQVSGGPPLYTHWRIGKKAAGRRLDGREHTAWPA